VSNTKLGRKIDDTSHQSMPGINEHRSNGMLNGGITPKPAKKISESHTNY